MVFFKAFSRLPLSLLYVLSDFFYLVLRYGLRYRWSVVLENLQNAFPEKTESERRRLANYFYRNLGDVFIETLKGLTISEAELRRRVVTRDADAFKTYAQRGTVVLGMTSHLGNWEWSAMRTRLELPGLDVVYKPLSNLFFDRLMHDIRSRFGTVPLPMQSLLRDMVKRRGEVRLVGLVADQAAEEPETAYWREFLHQETDFFTGTEKLARKFGYPVVFISMKRLRRGYYEMSAHRLGEPPYTDLPTNALIDRYVEKLEAFIREQPATWLWSHRRWKHKRADYVKS